MLRVMDAATVAIAAAVLFGAIALFQVALALGAPWGSFAYGGRAVADDGTLAPTYRLSSVFAAALLVLFAVVILLRGGAIGTSGDSALVMVMSWVTVAFMAVNTATNLVGKHWVERYLFGGVTVVLVALCSIVALAGPS